MRRATDRVCPGRPCKGEHPPSLRVLVVTFSPDRRSHSGGRKPKGHACIPIWLAGASGKPAPTCGGIHSAFRRQGPKYEKSAVSISSSVGSCPWWRSRVAATVTPTTGAHRCAPASGFRSGRFPLRFAERSGFLCIEPPGGPPRRAVGSAPSPSGYWVGDVESLVGLMLCMGSRIRLPRDLDLCKQAKAEARRRRQRRLDFAWEAASALQGFAFSRNRGVTMDLTRSPGLPWGIASSV